MAGPQGTLALLCRFCLTPGEASCRAGPGPAPDFSHSPPCPARGEAKPEKARLAPGSRETRPPDALRCAALALPRGGASAAAGRVRSASPPPPRGRVTAHARRQRPRAATASPRGPPGTVVLAGGIPRRAQTTAPAMPRGSPPAPSGAVAAWVPAGSGQERGSSPATGAAAAALPLAKRRTEDREAGEGSLRRGR